MLLKAILFDLGLTLTKTASYPEIYRSILARFGVTVSLDDIIRAQNATESEVEIANYDENQRKEIWTNYNVLLLEKLGVEKNTIFLAAQIDQLWWEYSQLQIYSDVEPTFSKLRAKGLKLGLVSNGFKQDIQHVLGELGIKNWFDVVVCIDSCNCAKPYREIFLYALKQLKVKASEALFVGDSIMYDYEGAMNVGIKPLLIDREGKIPSKYDTIASLTELLTIV